MTSPSSPGDLRAALSRLALTCADYAGLIAACRASVAAAARGDDDPLTYVRGLLGERGQLPAPGASPLLVLADARAALHMAGWPATRADGHVTGSPVPAWPLREARPVREITRMVTRPGPDDPTPPIAAPCGFLLLPSPGSSGGGGSFTDESACTGHTADGDRAGFARVALWEATLDGNPESARAARQWAARILSGCPAAASTVQALSELVANSAVHSRSAGRPASVRVRLIIAPGAWLRAEVRDDGPAPAGPGDSRPPQHAGGLPESGQGLGIVAALAASSGRADGMAWLVMPWQPGTVARHRRPGSALALTAAREGA